MAVVYYVKIDRSIELIVLTKEFLDKFLRDFGVLDVERDRVLGQVDSHETAVRTTTQKFICVKAILVYK